jgi:hypothetical protein
MADAAPEPDGDGGAGTRSASPATPDEGTEMGMGGHTHTPPPGEEPFTPHGSPVLDASVVFQPREKGGGVPGTSSFAPPTTRKPRPKTHLTRMDMGGVTDVLDMSMRKAVETGSSMHGEMKAGIQLLLNTHGLSAEDTARVMDAVQTMQEQVTLSTATRVTQQASETLKDRIDSHNADLGSAQRAIVQLESDSMQSETLWIQTRVDMALRDEKSACHNYETGTTMCGVQTGTGPIRRQTSHQSRPVRADEERVPSHFGLYGHFV